MPAAPYPTLKRLAGLSAVGGAVAPDRAKRYSGKGCPW